jgi:4-alpha-glucanotransferase
MTTKNTNKPFLDSPQAGVVLPIASLPGPYGIGEIGAPAHAFVDALSDMRLGVWQFLPTGPTAYGNSPYQPLSTFAGNEMLISIGDLVAEGLLAESEVGELRALPKESVDYVALIPVKSRLLANAAERFSCRLVGPIAERFRLFLEENDAAWLHEYALFRLLKARHDERPWPEWQAEYVHRDRDALLELESIAADRIRITKIVQFFFHEQWRKFREYARQKNVVLFGDMPIYIALDSSDAWADRDILRIDDDGRPDSVAGVPPDYFSDDGQLWGNPLYDWEAHASDGYQWWIDRLRAASRLVDIVRIDHFRGFESYWSVPADADTARVGSWEPGPRDAIFDALKKALGRLPLVAEDLGVITPEVEALRDRHQIPGMKVLQFAVDDRQFQLSAVIENSVCYTGTHDNDTTVGWFQGSPDDIRSAEEIDKSRQAVLEITHGTPETIHTDLIRAAFSTKALLAVAPMQDYLGLGSEARINTPGTTSGNWRWRLNDEQLTPEVCDNIATLVCASGRELSR